MYDSGRQIQLSLAIELLLSKCMSIALMQLYGMCRIQTIGPSRSDYIDPKKYVPTDKSTNALKAKAITSIVNYVGSTWKQNCK